MTCKDCVHYEVCEFENRLAKVITVFHYGWICRGDESKPKRKPKMLLKRGKENDT